MGHFPWLDVAHLQSQPLLEPLLTVCHIWLWLVKNFSLECVYQVIVYRRTDRHRDRWTDGHDHSNSLQPKCWLRAKKITRHAPKNMNYIFMLLEPFMHYPHAFHEYHKNNSAIIPLFMRIKIVILPDRVWSLVRSSQLSQLNRISVARLNSSARVRTYVVYFA